MNLHISNYYGSWFISIQVKLVNYGVDWFTLLSLDHQWVNVHVHGCLIVVLMIKSIVLRKCIPVIDIDIRRVYISSLYILHRLCHRVDATQNVLSVYFCCVLFAYWNAI